MMSLVFFLKPFSLSASNINRPLQNIEISFKETLLQRMYDYALRKCTWSEEPESQTASLLDLCTSPSPPQGQHSFA